MTEQDIITCPYCGSELQQQNEKYYCSFCEMILSANLVQRNYERIPVRVRDFALDVYLDRTTPELMRFSTYELLNLLKYARAERTNMYHMMKTFHKARAFDNTAHSSEYDEYEEYSGKEYEKITRKMFVLENILRQRLGYVPARITESYLARYLADMQKDKRTPMIVRRQRQEEIKSK